MFLKQSFFQNETNETAFYFVVILLNFNFVHEL